MTEIRRAIERVRPNLRIARVYEMTELHTNFTVYDYDHEPSTTNASLDINGNPEEFQEFHAAVYILYGVYVLIVFLMGISQNTVTVVVFVREKRLHMMHNFFIIGLAVSDTGMCLCGHWMIVVSSFSYRWIFRRAGCVFYGMLTTMFGITQISLLAAIAFDRFLIIVKPRGFKMTNRHAKVLVVCCYLYGFMWALFPVLGWSSYQLEGLKLRCAVNWKSQTDLDLSFSMTILVLAWIVPLVVILASYEKMYHWLRKERLRNSCLRQSHKNRQRKERKMAVTVLLMIGAFLLSWTPYSVATLVVAFGRVENVPALVSMLPALIAKTSIIWNPIIYVARHSLFRKALFEQVPCLHFFKRYTLISLTTRSSSQNTSTEMPPSNESNEDVVETVPSIAEDETHL